MNAHRIVAPAVDLDMTLGMVYSLDRRLVRDRLVVVDNTVDNRIAAEFANWANGPAVLAPSGNLGVAASWNLGAATAFAEGATYVTFTSTSMRFDPDGGAALTQITDFCVENTQWRYGFESLCGWHLLTLSRHLFKEVGWFDETFYPAYFEDSDMIWRMRCAGILEPAGSPRWDRRIPWVPTLIYPAIDTAYTIKNNDIVVDLAALSTYYEVKWGGPPGEEQWTLPFNGTRPDPHKGRRPRARP